MPASTFSVRGSSAFSWRSSFSPSGHIDRTSPAPAARISSADIPGGPANRAEGELAGRRSSNNRLERPAWLVRGRGGCARRRRSTGPLHGTGSAAEELVKVGELIRLLADDGWHLARTRGSHRQYKHPSKPGTVTVAGKPSLDIPPGTLNAILK